MIVIHFTLYDNIFAVSLNVWEAEIVVVSCPVLNDVFTVRCDVLEAEVFAVMAVSFDAKIWPEGDPVDVDPVRQDVIVGQDLLRSWDIDGQRLMTRLGLDGQGLLRWLDIDGDGLMRWLEIIGQRLNWRLVEELLLLLVAACNYRWSLLRQTIMESQACYFWA